MSSETNASRRRSARLARCTPVLLSWHDARGTAFDEPAQTMLISRYGGLLVCKTPIYPPGGSSLRWVERQKDAGVRIVYRELSGPDRLVRVAFEFLQDDDFWEIQFPRDYTLGP